MLTEGVVRTILSVIVVIVLIIILIRFTVKNKQPQKDSLNILKEKYENGEITKEAYDDALKNRGKK